MLESKWKYKYIYACVSAYSQEWGGDDGRGWSGVWPEPDWTLDRPWFFELLLLLDSWWRMDGEGDYGVGVVVISRC